MATKLNTFAAILDRAVKVEIAFARLGELRARKLTADAFVKQALALARTSHERLNTLSTEIGRPGTDHIAAFIRRASEGLRSPNWTSLPGDMAQIARVYGSEELVGQVSQTGFRLAEAIALAVRVAARDHPDDFGEAEDAEDTKRKFAALSAERDRLAAQVEFSWTPADIIIDASPSAVNPDERARGLARVAFKLAPDIVVSAPGAGRLLVERLANQRTAKAA